MSPWRSKQTYFIEKSLPVLWTAGIMNGSSLVDPFDNENFTVRVIPAHSNPERRQHKSLYISANSFAITIFNDLIYCRFRAVAKRNPLSIRDRVAPLLAQDCTVARESVLLHVGCQRNEVE